MVGAGWEDMLIMISQKRRLLVVAGGSGWALELGMPSRAETVGPARRHKEVGRVRAKMQPGARGPTS